QEDAHEFLLYTVDAMQEALYALYAVLVHHGVNCHSGHYICYVKVEVNSISNRVEVVLANQLKRD
ncbi:ubiquitin carboxyl-terminal hydrolase 36-like, partial [Mergus octosetaceus]